MTRKPAARKPAAKNDARVAAAKKAAATRRENARKRSEAAKKAARTRAAGKTKDEPAIVHPENLAAATSQQLPTLPEDSEVPTGTESKKQPAPAPSAKVGVIAREPVDGNVTTASARSDDDALVGHFASVIGGEYDGRYGVVEAAFEVGKDGYPTKATVRTRDERDEYITVAYKDLRRDVAGKR